jgi:hypothetical protein
MCGIRSALIRVYLRSSAANAFFSIFGCFPFSSDDARIAKQGIIDMSYRNAIIGPCQSAGRQVRYFEHAEAQVQEPTSLSCSE